MSQIRSPLRRHKKWNQPKAADVVDPENVIIVTVRDEKAVERCNRRMTRLDAEFRAAVNQDRQPPNSQNSTAPSPGIMWIVRQASRTAAANNRNPVA
jgi:hypothetical protein